MEGTRSGGKMQAAVVGRYLACRGKAETGGNEDMEIAATSRKYAGGGTQVKSRPKTGKGIPKNRLNNAEEGRMDGEDRN